ncbi:MAG: L,D-transpeptidase family protein [Niabella sp.]|nr:L,D-transpeptidase family protein [Niabella sp.]
MVVRRVLTAIFVLSLFAVVSCKHEEKKVKEKVIRIEKPVTKVDVTIDTANAFNQLFIDSSLVNSYLSGAKLSDTLVNRIKSFYNSRNYQYAWFSPEGVPEHTVSFWNMLKNYLNYSKDSTVYNKALAAKMESIINTDSLRIRNDSVYQHLELSLTKYFYLFADHAYAYDPGFDMKTLEWYIPKKKLTLQGMLDSAIAGKGQFSEAYAPTNPQYKKLRQQLQKYKAIKDAGGWPRVNSPVEVMKTGFKDPSVKALKKRLKIEGFLEGEDSTFTNTYDAELADAVNAIKKVYGYKEDGTAGKTFLKDVNVSIDERIQQILINMERMRWIPTETRDSGRAIMVNIPEYKMHVYENGRPAWDMNVVVGKESNNTTVFTGVLKTVVFSPYWNVPTSIVKKEMHGHPSAAYLDKNHMEILNGQVRQKPGPWNSLGLVKFLFPNSYNIYFHDSPAKSLFNKDKRSFSHGCIRLQEPAKFAAYVLDDSTHWDEYKIDSAMHSYKEKYVRVRKPIPVLITYFTAWVDDEDALNFREDIYGHDAVIAKKMFLNSVGTTYTRQKAIRDSLQQIKDSIKAKELELKLKRKADSLRRATGG